MYKMTHAVYRSMGYYKIDMTDDTNKVGKLSELYLHLYKPFYIILYCIQETLIINWSITWIVLNLKRVPRLILDLM